MFPAFLFPNLEEKKETPLSSSKEPVITNQKSDTANLSDEIIKQLGKANAKAPPGGSVKNIVQANQNNNYLNFNFIFNGTDFLKLLFNKSKDKFKKDFGSITKWANNNRRKAALYLIACCYGLIEAEIVYLLIKLSDPNCWSKWQKEKTIEQMYQIPQSKFSQMLLSDVQQHYTLISNPTDFVTPLIKFLYDSDCEIIYLKRYRFIVNLLKKFYINRFFFYNNSLYEEAGERLNRITFIRSTFLNWLADYKLNQNQKSVILKKFPGLANILKSEEETNLSIEQRDSKTI